MKYCSEIVAIGSEALEFLKDPDSRSLILFDYIDFAKEEGRYGRAGKRGYPANRQ